MLLAHPDFFPKRFIFENIIFAKMPVSADVEHSVVADLGKRALYCDCSFRPRPCVHAEALITLHDRAGAGIFEQTDICPEWVAALLNGRPAPNTQRPSEHLEEKATARQQRRSDRLDRAAHGLEDLETWLHDAMRRGLATLVSEEPDAFAHIASRMADASLPGLSRLLRLVAQCSPNRPDWAEQTLNSLAQCYLAIRAFGKRALLSEAFLTDLQVFIGIPVRREEVLSSGERVHDTWAVLGRKEEPLEDSNHVRRTWLLGLHTGRFALLLDFNFAGRGFEPGFPPGEVHSGELAFYPSAWPQRAIVPDTLTHLNERIKHPTGDTRLEDFAAYYARALAAQPWLAHFPAMLTDVLPVAQNDQFWIGDTTARMLPLSVLHNTGWQLLALSGGNPVTLFGEWDGSVLSPLSVWSDGRFVLL